MSIKILPFIVLLVCACCTQAQPYDEITMKAKLNEKIFDDSKHWIEYKKNFDALDNATSQEAVNKISDLMHASTTQLGIQFPKYIDILSDLSLLATAECNSRRRGLHSMLGRRVRPDYLKSLGISIERMLIQKKIMKFFIDENIRDKWVDSRIFTNGLKQSVAESLGHIDNLYMEKKYKKLQLTDQETKIINMAEADIKVANELIDLYENSSIMSKNNED